MRASPTIAANQSSLHANVLPERFSGGVCDTMVLLAFLIKRPQHTKSMQVSALIAFSVN
jgi:hypothetical protein